VISKGLVKGFLCIFQGRSQEFDLGGYKCSGVLLKNLGGYTLETRRRRRRAPSAEGARIEAPSGCGVLGERVSPSPADYGVWGSVVSSPIGVRGRAPATNAF